MDKLQEICERKKAHVEGLKKHTSFAEIRALAEKADNPRGFQSALLQKVQQKKPALIAEVKKASPSKGVIRENFKPEEHAADYERAGAACLSVLTDKPYFAGQNEYLQAARAAVSIPVLRKDFIVDEWQVYESRAIGADCILLIMAAITDGEAARFEEVASTLGMDCLVEVHDEAELERALKLKSRLIGINNRNLKTLQVDLRTSIRLSKILSFPRRRESSREAASLDTGLRRYDEYVVVCESGIKTHDDILRMVNENIYCFLVGESLMAQPDIYEATRRLLADN